MTIRRFRVGAVPVDGAVTLDPASSHHLLAVCRVPRGGALAVFDGLGAEADAVLDDVTDDRCAVVRIVGEVRRSSPAPALHLILAIPKGPALDHALRMAVEVGVTHLHPVTTERTVPKGDRIDRWTRICVAAAEQCRRSDLPTLAPLSPLLDAIDRIPPTIDRRVAVPGAARQAPSTGDAALAIGPEGGFAPKEVQRLVDRGWAPIGLGPHVLRVDTAVVVGITRLVA
ncbi:MAG: RsmE family RNA methyltransferase [Myxococcota bacterium]